MHHGRSEFKKDGKTCFWFLCSYSSTAYYLREGDVLSVSICRWTLWISVFGLFFFFSALDFSREEDFLLTRGRPFAARDEDQVGRCDC